MIEKQTRIWQLILHSLAQSIPVMMLYVLESKGSSPGRRGFFMAVNANGEMQGSIGGGIMEHKLVALAKEKLAQNAEEASIRQQVHNKAAAKNQSGMICSGEQTVFIYRLQADAKPCIQAIETCLQQYKNGLLQLSPNGLLFSPDIPVDDYRFTYTSHNDWLYQEKLGYKHTLHIVGAGHCALALSRLMRTLDFFICLYDNRPGLTTMTENEYVHQKRILKDYGEVANWIPSGDHEYVVVMTMGYRTDDSAIRALLQKQLKYLGVLGSKKKLEKLFAGISKEGVTADWLKNIAAPIGLPINSQTPEEIAVSIAAQIIALKNQP